MAKIKIKNNRTGEIIEIDEKERGNYGLQSPQQTEQQKVLDVLAKNAVITDNNTAPKPDNRSVLQGNLQSQNLVSGQGLLSNILNAIAKPAVKTGQTIGGGTFEIGRLLSSKLGNENAYATQNGKPVIENPFLSMEKLQQHN